MKSILLSLTALAASALASNDAVLLPKPNGKYATDIKVLELVDHDRVDPYDPNEGPRKLMVSVIRPTMLAEECKHPEPYLYTPNKTAEILGPLTDFYGWPNSTSYLKRLRLPVCPGRVLREEFPVVLFSHGLGVSRLISSSQAQAVASKGFIVITMDHPYDAAVIEYPEGSLTLGRETWTNQELDTDVQVRSQDASFVVDFLKSKHSALRQHCGSGAEKVAIFGHSLGGATSVRATHDDTRFLGAIDLDGSPYGFNTTGTNNDTAFHLPTLTSPFLLFNEPPFVDSAGMPELYDVFTGYKRHSSLEGSFHLTFTDLPLLVDTFGLRGSLPKEFEEYSGTIDGLKARDVVAEYVAAFMGRVLKGERGALLDGPSEEWPEVDFEQIG